MQRMSDIAAELVDALTHRCDAMGDRQLMGQGSAHGLIPLDAVDEPKGREKSESEYQPDLRPPYASDGSPAESEQTGSDDLQAEADELAFHAAPCAKTSRGHDALNGAHHTDSRADVASNQAFWSDIVVTVLPSGLVAVEIEFIAADPQNAGRPQPARTLSFALSSEHCRDVGQAMTAAALRAELGEYEDA